MSVPSPLVPLDRRGHAIDLRPIAPIIARVVLRWNPLQIWLFGSRARGDADVDSDWDLLAVVPDCPEPADFDDPMTVWRVKRQPDVPCDLVVYRASDFEADRAVPNTLAYATRLDGVLLYDLATRRTLLAEYTAQYWRDASSLTRTMRSVRSMRYGGRSNSPIRTGPSRKSAKRISRCTS